MSGGGAPPGGAIVRPGPEPGSEGWRVEVQRSLGSHDEPGDGVLPRVGPVVTADGAVPGPANPAEGSASPSWQPQTRESDTASPPVLGVIGAGTLGISVVQACLAAGSRVTLLVRGGEEGVAAKGWAIARALQRDADRGVLPSEQARERLERLEVTSDPARLSGADVVLESVAEDVAAKRAVIATIESMVDDSCLIASTTSSIPAATLAVGAARPERIVVTHYFWPAHRMPLVEVALHARCNPAARQRLHWLLASQGKHVLQTADRPGFLTTRALFAHWDGAIRLVCQGHDPAEVDEALEGYGWPLGPFRVMDAAGLRSVARIHEWLAPSLGHRFRSLALLPGMIAAGMESFYDRTESGRRSRPEVAGYLRGTQPVPDRSCGAERDQALARVMDALAGEVALAVSEGVLATRDDAAAAYDLAFGFTGPNGGLRAWMAAAGDAEAPAAALLQPSPFMAGLTPT